MISPVSFTQADINYIKRIIQTYSYEWDNDAIEDCDKEEFVQFKKKIKQYLIEAQNNKCCYCFHTLQSTHGLVWDIEHIMPKKNYPIYTYHELNLCVSCKECNQRKYNKEVMFNKHLSVPYPTSEKFIIYHPIYDDYEEHIRLEFIDENLYVHHSITDKGASLISVCGLIRFSQKVAKMKNVKERRRKALMDIISRIPDSELIESLMLNQL